MRLSFSNPELLNFKVKPTPKSLKACHCEARSNLILLIICMLRLLLRQLADRNDEKPLFGVDSKFWFPAFVVLTIPKFHTVEVDNMAIFSIHFK